jgi:hypothetical protein
MTTTKLPNIIFLDMDGVLCNPRACLAVGNNGMYSYLDPIACLLVKKLCEECNAKLVISSMWRHHYNKDAMEAILNAACSKLGNYIWNSDIWWKTADHSFTDFETQSSTSDRGREIKNWVDNHQTKFNNFVILDDMGDMRPVQDSLVKCCPYDGIGYLEYHNAQKILMAEN